MNTFKEGLIAIVEGLALLNLFLVPSVVTFAAYNKAGLYVYLFVVALSVINGYVYTRLLREHQTPLQMWLLKHNTALSTLPKHDHGLEGLLERG